ncbi:MAG: carbon storage regulator CsrA [Planctomycetota bacterium]
MKCLFQQQERKAMLVLTRKAGEAIYLGDNIKVTMVRVRGGQVRIAIDAPKEVRIDREEIHESQQCPRLDRASLDRARVPASTMARYNGVAS